ncbi:hypothetical protein [Paenibacillus sp. YPG26]|uniref:hypothetical protein n=1 Tax=Paenibacillus sp. YPG26 TaxID=2878915 RepID=UPI00203EBA35|nr:hypothetical protein [Paenibacillus sp. YPG26]USB31606.1 hypothetical protein LDO05_09560 [Paenibacillus sp. YPG26]
MRRNSPKWEREFEDELDALIYEAIITSPLASLPSREQKRDSWLSISEAIRQDKRRHNFWRRFRWIGMAAAGLTASALIWPVPTITQTMSPILQHAQMLGMGFAQVVIVHEDCIGTKHVNASPSQAADEEPHDRSTSPKEHRLGVLTHKDAVYRISFVLPTLPTPPSPDL